MAEYGSPISLSLMSQTSEDESFDQNNLNISDNGASGWPFPHTRQPSSSIEHYHYYNQALTPPEKKLRGRPPGSKNRPKPPIVITQNNDELLKPVVIEVSIGYDVVEALVNFARGRNVCISVLSGSGSIANVKLHHPLTLSPSFTLHGPFTLLALTGSYICGPSSHPCASFPAMAPSSSSSTFNPNHPYSITSNYFGVSLLGSQGEIFGGVVAGKLVAGSTVSVVATMFKNPEFYKVGFNGYDAGGADEEDHNPNASGNDRMSNFMYPQVPYADVNVI